MSVTGDWSGLMEVKYNDGSNRKGEVFVDVNRIPIFKKQVRPISQQEDDESRKIWRDVTVGLRLVFLIWMVLEFVMFLFNIIFRTNDIDKATNSKYQVEQKQREEAKTRKDGNHEWATKVKDILFFPILTITNFEFISISISNQSVNNGYTQNL